MFFLASLLLFAAAAACALGMLGCARICASSAAPQEEKRRAFLRLIAFLMAAIFLAISGGVFGGLQQPVLESTGMISEVRVVSRGVRDRSRTEIFLKIDGGQGAGQTMGFAAFGFDKHFCAGERTTLHWKPGGEIVDAEFHDAAGHYDGQFRVYAYAQPLFALAVGLISLYFALRPSQLKQAG